MRNSTTCTTYSAPTRCDGDDGTASPLRKTAVILMDDGRDDETGAGVEINRVSVTRSRRLRDRDLYRSGTTVKQAWPQTVGATPGLTWGEGP
jgi:hypothetical protein